MVIAVESLAKAFLSEFSTMVHLNVGPLSQPQDAIS